MNPDKLKPYAVQDFKNIRHMVDLAAEESGDKIAYKYFEKKEIKEVTFREFKLITEYLGTAINDLGFGSAHIANIGINSFKWISIYFTVLKSAGVYVPIDKELPEADIINVANNSESELLFYANKFESFFKENRDKFPGIKYFVGLDRQEDEGEFLSYDKLLKKGKELYEAGNREYEKLSSDPHELKMLVYTSGTTGKSKGVMLTEHNLKSSIYYGLQASKIFDSCLSVLPYHHTYEAVPGILVALHHRATLCINDKLTNVLKNLQTFKPEYIFLVPAFAELFYKKIWATLKEKKIDGLFKVMIAVSNGLRKVGIDVRRKLFKSVIDNFGGNLKEIVCGGAPIRAEIGKFFDSIGIILFNGYGITECSPLVSVNRVECNDPSTVGMLLPCLDIRIEEPDSDGIGEICVKGDVVMMGYYKEPELTAEVLSQDGWFKTGDYGYVNKAGLLVITGRKKNLIVLSNGKNIYPEEIEEYIQGIPYVKEVVVYSIKDENGMEDALCAEVFPDTESEEYKTSDNFADKLKKDIAEATKVLPTYKKISTVKVREEAFIKNSSNKIKRNLINKD
ncbi:MAG: AMP-binding protein [Clostridia bacterium]|nr:AMP-binding protein [Clostridia bacterium]